MLSETKRPRMKSSTNSHVESKTVDLTEYENSGVKGWENSREESRNVD